MRIKINFQKSFTFSVAIPVRISDINYGGHVGNDHILSIVHEARMAFFKSYGQTEMHAGGVNLIMADSAVQYKGESFHGDTILVEIYTDNITAISFDLFYKLTTIREEKKIDIAYVKTGMICFDYSTRKIVNITETLENILK
jgi:acyl-CoA thioester hydrolase